MYAPISAAAECFSGLSSHPDQSGKGKARSRHGVVMALHLVVMQNKELPLEASAFHRLQDSLGTIETPHQQHPHEVGIAAIGMHVGSRPESPNLHGIQQPVVLIVNDMNVPETEKEKMHELVRHPEMAQGMHERKYLGGPQKRHNHQYDGIRFQRYQERLVYTLTLNTQWP
jgi:hypothetical protein